MKILLALLIIFITSAVPLSGQSGRVKNYSESSPQFSEVSEKTQTVITSIQNDAEEVVKINTKLVLIPVKITNRRGEPVSDVRREEFKIFENGIEQEIEYFSDQEQPFTVALMLDMSYSSVFKLKEIQAAAMLFINQLRPNDKVMIVSFDKDVRILCEPTDDKKVLKLAIEATRIASGTGLYSALNTVLTEKFNKIKERKAVVLLSDGVDTTSRDITSRDIVDTFSGNEVIFYSIKYDTYEDVQKNRKKDAQVFYDEDDRPYIVEKAQKTGEKTADYEAADEFLETLSEETGGKLYQVSSTKNLNKSFTFIAEELRKIYSLGYYPKEKAGKEPVNHINVRVYRPNLKIRTKTVYKAL